MSTSEAENGVKEENCVENRHELSDEERKKIEQRIQHQVEYYFGDINLPRDKFMQEKLKDNDGWIPLTTLLTFNRLSSITKDISLIAASLASLELVKVSEDGQSVKRNPDIKLPENCAEYWKELKSRTAYVGGFTSEMTLDQLLDFFKQFGEVENVSRKRKDDESSSRGVYCTFKTIGMAKEFVENDVKEWNGCVLSKMMQSDYWKEKQLKEKERRLNDREAKANKKLESAEIIASSRKHNFEITRGVILSVSNLPNGATEETLRTYFGNFGRVAFIAHGNDVNKAQIRFKGDENAAKAVWEAAVAASSDGNVTINGCEIAGYVLEGAEEDEYWECFKKKRDEGMERLPHQRRVGRQSRFMKRKSDGSTGAFNSGPKQKKIVFNEDEE